MMKHTWNRGFTLVELMVALSILAIVSAIAVPGLTGYIHLSQFRRNDSYAKTMYYAVEAVLTDYRRSGEWDSFRNEVILHGEANPHLEDGSRVYAICLDANEYGEDMTGDGRLVAELLEGTTYDKSLLSAAIALEIDVKSGRLYSVFYGTHCQALTYGTGLPAGQLSLSAPEYETRREGRLGYYSAGELVENWDLDLVQLKINSVYLLNGETLTLNWSSNSVHDNRDLGFHIKLHRAADGQELLSADLNCGDNMLSERITCVVMAVSVEQGIGSDYVFPLSYSDGAFSLTLDAMMTAELMDTLEQNPRALERTSSTGITRFGGALSEPQEVYATIQAYPTYKNMGNDTRVYMDSSLAKSNTVNTMFADGSKGRTYELTTFRHLSNIRYMDGVQGTFTVTVNELDWRAARSAVYTTDAAGALTALNGAQQAFPTIERLSRGQTLTGKQGTVQLRNLLLNGDSVNGDAKYLGLFGENYGSIRSVSLTDTRVDYSGRRLIGIGGLCGRNLGTLDHVASDGQTAMRIELPDDGQFRCVGGIAGMNENGGTISRSTLGGGRITVRNGMTGGIVGYNNGSIRNSGDAQTAAAISGGFSAEARSVVYDSAADIDSLQYADGSYVRADCNLEIVFSGTGSLGGIIGNNGSDGRADNCGTGKWLLMNQSDAADSVVGGVIGINESGRELSCLVNRAFTARQGSDDGTVKYAGGVIGLQANSSDEGWRLSDCRNYGLVYGYGSCYAGGIIGCWSGTGGMVFACGSYGAVQTTSTGGAAAGIAALLYEPAAYQSYSMVGCENHGNIYGRSGEDTAMGARLGAGIVAEIAAVNAPGTVMNVVDCVNGAGTEIYSSNLACGIVGAFSDTEDGSVVLNIDRCRNYAYILQGKNAVGGILGERCGSAGKSTYIQNCYSVYNEAGSRKAYPIVSLEKGSSAVISLACVGNNYYFDHEGMENTGERLSTSVVSFGGSGVQQDLGAREYAVAGTRAVRFAQSSEGSYLFMQSGGDSEYGENNAQGQLRAVTRYNGYRTDNSYIADDNRTIFSGDASGLPFVSGKVLFYADRAYSFVEIRRKGSGFDTYVRETYRRLEDGYGTQLQPPAVNTVTEENGTYSVTVYDSARPLYYEVVFTDDAGRKLAVRQIFPREKADEAGNYTTSARFPLGTEGLSVQLRSVSMFGDVSASAYVPGNHEAERPRLPAPRLSGVLLHEGTEYVCRYTLENWEEYASYGGSLFVELNAQGQRFRMDDKTSVVTVPAVGSLTVQARSENNLKWWDSAAETVSAWPEGALTEFTADISGDSRDNLVITATVGHDGSYSNTYRVELLGTLDGVEQVLAWTDVNPQAGESAAAVFSALPSGVTEASDLRLRVWYAGSAENNVTAYKPVDTAGESNVTILTEKDGGGSCMYLYSTVLAQPSDFPDLVRTISLDALSFWEEPVLMTLTQLQPEPTVDGGLTYSFCWSGAEGAEYAVQLFGLSGEEETVIPIDGAYTDARGLSFTIDGAGWSYTSVRLSVTCLGNDDTDQIGCTVSREYPLAVQTEPEPPAEEQESME